MARILFLFHLVTILSFIVTSVTSPTLPVSDSPGNIHEDVNLEPADILLPEIVSVAEDPAYAIIRKAIAKKHEWEKLLKSYSFKAFTRLIIYRDTSLAGITESYTDGYWQEGDSLHEVVTQKRETKNLPEAGLIPSVGEIVNFTDDVIEFVGYKFVGLDCRERTRLLQVQTPENLQEKWRRSV